MMPVSADEFRSALRRFASGVTIVTAARDGRRHGMTVSAFSSVSADPPLVLVCLRGGTRTHALVRAAGRFAVSLLAAGHRSVSERFAGLSGNQADRFEGLVFRDAPGGAPVLDGALAWLDCAVVGSTDAGDHTIFVGRVEACGSGGGEPLLYHDGRYRAAGGEAPP